MSWLSAAWHWYSYPVVTAAGTVAHPHADLVNPIAAFTGGMAVAVAALWQASTARSRHREQTNADRQRRITETFSKAVEQLANDKIEARLGGIYTLERLALEAIASLRSPPWWRRWWPQRNRSTSADPVSDLYWTVMETLTAFVRERAKWQEQTVPPASPPVNTDTAAVLAVIRRRPATGWAREKQRSWSFDLSETNLRGANLARAHLETATLSATNLRGAALLSAHLEDSMLSRAHLENAYLFQAHLERSYLLGAHLEGARLDRAHLEGANLSLATGLTDEQLAAAYGDATTRLPSDVKRPAHWPPGEPENDPA